ncbi:hypothetical protein DFH06DRAFT_1480329 [Mycena polygramma]|nr:hypothetical protein DFH06DRAFT_1480329 [Mycena polygramma]
MPPAFIPNAQVQLEKNYTHLSQFPVTTAPQTERFDRHAAASDHAVESQSRPATRHAKDKVRSDSIALARLVKRMIPRAQEYLDSAPARRLLTPAGLLAKPALSVRLHHRLLPNHAYLYAAASACGQVDESALDESNTLDRRNHGSESIRPREELKARRKPVEPVWKVATSAAALVDERKRREYLAFTFAIREHPSAQTRLRLPPKGRGHVSSAILPFTVQALGPLASDEDGTHLPMQYARAAHALAHQYAAWAIASRSIPRHDSGSPRPSRHPRRAQSHAPSNA